MKNAQKPEKAALANILSQLKEGRYVIPDFQREFEWRPWDISDLLKSILLDYYIGTLLLWKGKEDNFDKLSCESIYAHEGDNRREYIVLDGQQRLTAIYYAFFGPDKNFPNRKKPVSFYVRIDKFKEGNYDECIEYQFVGPRWRQINNTPAEQYKRHIFPFTLIGKGPRAVISWLDGYEKYWRELADMAVEEDNEQQANDYTSYADYTSVFDKEIEELERDYQISYIELDKEIAIEKVCDIFTQINSKGVRLDIFDLLNAMLKPKDIMLKSMWREASSKLDYLGTPKMNVYVLQVMSILLQAYCSSKYLYFLIPGEKKTIRNPDGGNEQVVLIKNAEEFNYHWGEAVDALHLAIETLRNPRDYGAITSSFIPYPSIVPAFSAIRRYARQNNLLKRVDVNQKIRKWYWSSIFTTRYSSSVESTSARDFMAMKKWFDDDEVVPTAIREFEESFRTLDLVYENKKGAAIYNAILNLLIIRGAKDLGTFQLPEYDDLDDHHIVPASWGREKVGPEIHSILNKTPISSDTNRKILRDRLPNVYIRDLIDENGREEVQKILDTHYITKAAADILLREDFGVDDYKEFIEERRKAIFQGIQEKLISDQIDIEVPDQELDDNIERIEFRLRALISEALSGDATKLPQHIQVKVNERIQRMLKKDASKKLDDFTKLSQQLEYFDLREYQGAITSKSLWQFFEDLFNSKESLNKKFDQLGELRNTYRHSRSLDDVTRKEGEAAILWFNKILK